MSGHLVRVIRGRPNEEELAAITAVMSVTEPGETPPPAQPPPRGRWNDPAWAHQRPLRPGPGAWRAAAWPG